MYQLEAIQHRDITSKQLTEIIYIKSQAWSYSYSAQRQWIVDNIVNEDFHLLLKKDNEFVAYLNLIDIEVRIDNEPLNMFGVGNVCAKEKRMGYGGRLIQATNDFINYKKRVGLLFCKQNLIEFYSQFNWYLIDKNILSLSFDNANIHTMLFNFVGKPNSIVYYGKPF